MSDHPADNSSTYEYRCICDPAVLFEPPDRTPVAVEGCPAHRARRAVQSWIRANEPGPFGWRCVEHPGPAECANADSCRIRLIGTEEQP